MSEAALMDLLQDNLCCFTVRYVLRLIPRQCSIAAAPSGRHAWWFLVYCRMLLCSSLRHHHLLRRQNNRRHFMLSHVADMFNGSTGRPAHRQIKVGDAGRVAGVRRLLVRLCPKPSLCSHSQHTYSPIQRHAGCTQDVRASVQADLSCKSASW